jgi:hypothetical protein
VVSVSHQPSSTTLSWVLPGHLPATPASALGGKDAASNFSGTWERQSLKINHATAKNLQEYGKTSPLMSDNGVPILSTRAEQSKDRRNYNHWGADSKLPFLVAWFCISKTVLFFLHSG